MNNRFSRVIRLVTAALAVMFLGAGCASLRAVDPRTDDPAERAQIEHRMQEVFAAAAAKDFNQLDGYHLYGPRFTKFSGSSPERLDASGSRKGEHDGLGQSTV